MENCQIYILTLDRGAYYIGYTSDLSGEIEEHYRGLIEYTSGKNPQLVWSEKCPDGQESAIRGRMNEWNHLLLSSNPDVIVYRLQARLPLGGFHWG